MCVCVCVCEFEKGFIIGIGGKWCLVTMVLQQQQQQQRLLVLLTFKKEVRKQISSAKLQNTLTIRHTLSRTHRHSHTHTLFRTDTDTEPNALKRLQFANF